MRKIRVLIADDAPVIRDGLQSILSGVPDVEVVGEATNGAEAVMKAAQLGPDVVIMDDDMPRMDGVEATRRIKHQRPLIRILFLAVFPHYVSPAMKAGADRYLPKDFQWEDLVRSIRSLGGEENLPCSNNSHSQPRNSSHAPPPKRK